MAFTIGTKTHRLNSKYTSYPVKLENIFYNTWLKIRIKNITATRAFMASFVSLFMTVFPYIPTTSVVHG